MGNSIRVMVERGKQKRTVACAFDWSGWDRSGVIEEEALRVLESYRPRYAKVAALAGLSDQFGARAGWPSPSGSKASAGRTTTAFRAGRPVPSRSR